MNIVILSYAEVANIIGATLLDRGHRITWFGGGVVNEAVADHLSDHDGCLLVGAEPELEEFTQLFRTRGKMIWRQWTDIPPTKEWPNGGYLASLSDKNA